MAGQGTCSRRSMAASTRLTALIVAACAATTTVQGQPVMTEVTALARAYGAGVHAYFSGDVQRAYDDLTQAIEAGTSDPRAWYFRGLAALKLGRVDEAEADFSTAATRETEADGDWAVSRSLERVQGHDRLALERHRVRARVAGYEQRKQAVERRYSQIESLQSDVLRERRPEGSSPDSAGQFGAEEVVPPVPETPTTAPVDEPAGPAPTDAVREPATEDPASPVEPEPAESEPATEPPMEDATPAAEAEPEAPPAPAIEADDPPMAEDAPGTDPAADGEKAAETEDDPADPPASGDETMEEKAAEGGAPPSPDAPGDDVFGK